MPKIIDKAAKRQEILQAAIRVFAERGVGKTKMADIARRAEIGKGTIYEYFSSKEDIFQEAMHLFMGILEKCVVESMRGAKDPREKIRRLVWGMVESSIAQIEYIQITLDFWAVGVRTEQYGQWKEAYEQFTEMISSILEDGIQQKIFRRVDTFSLALALMGLCDGLLFQMVLFGKEYPIRDTVETVLDNFIRGLEMR